MNEAARKTWEMLQDGTGNPLSYENIETTRAAFHIAMDFITNVTSSDAGLCAIGFTGSPEPTVAWVNVDGSSGYQKYQPVWVELKTQRPSTAVRFWREARWRLARAWDALCGRDQ